MKRKVKWNILLFLVLAVLLTIGISYIGLNQNVSKNKSTPDKEETHKMSIAFVNEDQGAELSGKKYTFGDDIQTSVLKDKSHDWTTVSRGVAESGLKRDVYNLMIIIPDNFSKKALSLTSTSPEKIQVDYKINDVGNNDLKVEAEKTASNLVADINQRVIDVYFASILTNLQEAQDNISTLVAKEKKHTARYDNTVNNPLANYTNQFEAVQNYTSSSKESFSGFQDLLNGQKTALLDASKENAAYQKTLEGLVTLQEKNAPFGTTFADNLQKYSASLSSDSVQNELGTLEQANLVLYSELQSMQDSMSLMSQTQALQNYIEDVNKRITTLDTEMNNTIQADILHDVQVELTDILSGKSGGSNESYTINDLRADVNNRFINRLKAEINGLQYFDSEDEELLGLSSDEYQRVKVLAKQFMNENSADFAEDKLNQKTKKTTILDSLQPVKDNKIQELTNTGVTIESKEVTLDETDENEQTEIKIQYDPNFTLSDIKILEDGIEIGSSVAPGEPGEDTVTFTQTKGAPHTYKISFVAKLNSATDISFFGNLDVSLMAIQKMHKYVLKDDTLIMDPALTNTDLEDTELTQNALLIPIEKNDPFFKEADFTEAGKEMFREIQSIVRNYERSALLFQLYYGINVNSPNYSFEFRQKLEDQATNSSYYAIFNRDNLLDAIVEKASGNVTKAYKDKLSNFEAQIASYKQTMSDANDRSVDVAERLVKTSSEAAAQNESLAKMISEVDLWRSASSDLLKENQVVLQSGSDEKSAAMMVNSDFGGLLARSQSLADSTGSNLNAADGVYKTFDAIDQEAKNIQTSGKDLISEAGTLSKDLAKKLASDETFSKNFSGVMSNSRVGDRPNEGLYQFLSSPVEKVNGKTIAAGDKATPYYMVLIMTLIALFTSYVISHQEKKRIQHDAFSEELSLASKNLPITFLTAFVAIAEGIIIGAISGNIFNTSHIGFILWMGICVILMLMLVMSFTYLLRQLQMVGMFIILSLVGIYLFLTDAVGLNIDRSSIFGTLQTYSPLQYIEVLLNRILNGENNFLILMYIFIGVAALFIVLNLFVIRKSTVESEEAANEDI